MLKPTYFGILILLLIFCTTKAKLIGWRHDVSQPSRELNSGDGDNIGDYVSPVASPMHTSDDEDDADDDDDDDCDDDDDEDDYISPVASPVHTSGDDDDDDDDGCDDDDDDDDDDDYISPVASPVHSIGDDDDDDDDDCDDDDDDDDDYISPVASPVHSIGDDDDDYVSPVGSPVYTGNDDDDGKSGKRGGKNGKGGKVPFTIEELLTVAEMRIREAISNNPFIAPSFLRLAFHDCAPNGAAGGCDGCINLSHEENFGLLPPIQALSGIVADLENPALGVSRADIWAFAALVASEVSQFEITFIDKFQVGRKNCETVGTCDSSTTDCIVKGPDQITDFPSPESATHELLTYMREHFDFNADQTVAIMGAHTMGRALPENTGYEGQFGWVTNPLSLDNAYYLSLVGPPQNLEEGPDWIQIQVPSGEHQWIPSAQGSTPHLMLNVDIAIVRDLGIQNNTEPSGFATCTFRFPPTSMCPLAATLSKAGVYRENNLEWLKDFKNVLHLMLSKGL